MRLITSTVLLLLVFQLPVAGQDKAKVKCGPADANRLLFKEAATINIEARVPCGEEVEVTEYVSKTNAYKVQRGSGESGYILGDAIDSTGLHLRSESAQKPLINADILDMVAAGIGPDIIVAKIKTSTANFDTTPATLKELKTKGVPDGVVLAMVQTPAVPADGTRSESQSSTNTLSAQPSAAPSDAAAKQADEKRRQAMQKANDDLEDCRTRAQNEYETKMNALGTLAISPMMRVAAASKLKQNLDAELRACRAQYESRLKSIQ
jgi:uncharacterized protein YgiM (DUF1202 family)